MDGKSSSDKPNQSFLKHLPRPDRFLKAALLGSALLAEPETFDQGDSRTPVVSLSIRAEGERAEGKEALPKLLITEENLPDLLPLLMKNWKGQEKYQIEFDPSDFPSIINPQNVQRNIDAAEQLNRWGYFWAYVDGVATEDRLGFNYGPMVKGGEFQSFGLGDILLEKSTFEGFPQVTIEDPVAMKNDFIEALESIDILYWKAGVRSDTIDLFFAKADLSACPDLATDEDAFNEYEKFWERYVDYKEDDYGRGDISTDKSDEIIPILEKMMKRRGLNLKNFYDVDSEFAHRLNEAWRPEVIPVVATREEEIGGVTSLETYFEIYPEKWSENVIGNYGSGGRGHQLQVTVTDEWSPQTIKLLREADQRWGDFSVITSPDVPANRWNQPRSWLDVSHILDVAEGDPALYITTGDPALLRFVDFSLLPIVSGDAESIYKLPELLGLEPGRQALNQDVAKKMFARLEFSSVPFSVTSENVPLILKEAQALREVFGEAAERVYLDRLDFSGYANTFDMEHIDQVLSTVQEFEQHRYYILGSKIDQRPLRDAYIRQVKVPEINEVETIPIVVTPDQIGRVAGQHAMISSVLGQIASDFYLAHLRFTDMSVQMNDSSIAEMGVRIELIGGQFGDRAAEVKFIDTYIHAIDFSSFPQTVHANTISQILDGASLLAGYRSYGSEGMLDEYIRRLDRPLVPDDFRLFVANEKDFGSLAQRYNDIDQIFGRGVADAYIANAKFSFLPSGNPSASLSQRLDRTAVLMEKASEKIADDDEWRDDDAVRSSSALKTLRARFSGEVTAQQVEQLHDVLTPATARTIETRFSLLRDIGPDFGEMYLSGLIIPDISSQVTPNNIRTLSLLSVGPVESEYKRRLMSDIQEQRFEGFLLAVSRKNVSEIASVHQDIERVLGVEIGQEYFDKLSFSEKEFPRQFTENNFKQIGESLLLLKNTGGKPFADAYARTIEPVEMIKFAPVITNDNLEEEYAKKIVLEEYGIGVSEESIKSTIKFTLPESISTFSAYQDILRQIDMVALFNPETAASLRRSIEERIDWKELLGGANLLDVKEIESLRLRVNEEMGAGLGDEILMQVGVRFIDSRPVTWDTIDVKLRFVEAYSGVGVGPDVKGMYEMLANFQVTQLLKFFENEGVSLDDERVAAAVLQMQAVGINIPTEDGSMSKVLRSWNQPVYLIQKAKSKLSSDTGILREELRDVQISVEGRSEKLKSGYKFLTWSDGSGDELAKVVVGDPKQGAFVDYAVQVGGGLTEEAIRSRYPGEEIIAESVGAYTTGALKPAELAIENGKVKNYLISDRDGMAIVSKKGELLIVHRDKLTTHDLDAGAESRHLSFNRNISDFRTLLSVAEKRELDIMCGHLLVDDGELSVSDQSSEVKDKRRAIVTFKDGTFGLVDFSEPITLYEEAVILKAAGASNAINLDTGYYDHANIYTADGNRIELGDQDKDGTNNKFVFFARKE